MTDGRDRQDDERAGAAGGGPTKRAGGQPPGSSRDQERGAGDFPDVDRDSGRQADYGGSAQHRDEITSEDQQGGLHEDESREAGSTERGREPTTERDRDYDPDGDRIGR